MQASKCAVPYSTFHVLQTYCLTVIKCYVVVLIIVKYTCIFNCLYPFSLLRYKSIYWPKHCRNYNTHLCNLYQAKIIVCENNSSFYLKVMVLSMFNHLSKQQQHRSPKFK